MRSPDTGASAGDNTGNSTNQAGGASSGDVATGEACELPGMRTWVNENMHDYYLFYDQVPTVNINDYSTVKNLLTDLRVSPYDRYSYIADEAQSTALFEKGKRFGFGMRLKWTSATDLQFVLINPGSPLDQLNINRGDKLIAIDNIDMKNITSAQLDISLGTGTQVVSPTFTIENSSGVRRDIIVEKAEFDMQTVLTSEVIASSGSRVGYLHFLSFLETSSAELDQAIGGFKQQGIDELVLDLRYNSGGRISVANELASKIIGSLGTGNDFARIAFNDRYSEYNLNKPFLDQTTALDLSRVFVLTTEDTCSASEMVINGLRPFIDVITIGSTSCGKPYGTSGRTRCGKVMHALEVEFVNANNVGGYFNGITADCPAEDNVEHTLGSASDALFATATEYIHTGSCALAANQAKSRIRSTPAIYPEQDETHVLYNRLTP